MGFPTPPLDGAGGRLIIRIRREGVASFHVGVHIPEFAAAPESTAVVGNTLTDWAYTSAGLAAAGGSNPEATVGQTAVDLIDAIKPLYDAGFKLQPSGLYRITREAINGVVTTIAEQVFPVPNVGPILGSYGQADDPGASTRLVTSYYSGRSRGNANDAANPRSGRRFRLALRAIPGRNAGWFVPVTPNSGGYNQPYAYSLAGPVNTDQHAEDQALVGYLSQATTINGFSSVVLAHDGTPPYPQFELETNTTKRAMRAMKRDAA